MDRQIGEVEMLRVPMLVLLTVVCCQPSCQWCCCFESRLSKTDAGLLDPAGQFSLIVANQSPRIENIDIRITIDGELVVHEEFCVCDHHNWKEFSLRLKPGRHHMDIDSVRGSAALSVDFDSKATTSALVEYYYEPYWVPHQFQFDLSEEGFGLM